MSVNRFNAEGYPDPTAYEALKIIEKQEKSNKFMPVVYICSPYSGDIKINTENARKYCRFAVDRGYIPIAPHLLLPQFMSDTTERDLAIFMDLALLSKCAEIWVFGSHISKGMNVEITKAKNKGKPIKYFTEACEVVST